MKKLDLTKVYENYLTTHIWPESYLTDLALPDTDIIVVIPAFNENEIEKSLCSLLNADRDTLKITIIIVINAAISMPEHIKATNQRCFQKCKFIATEVHQNVTILPVLLNALPDKTAGVGLARKIGMDEAIRIYSIQKREGIIICFDADSMCTENFFKVIYKEFNAAPYPDAVSIYYEHPLDGVEYEKNIYFAITLYELHLRYYIQFQRYIDLPFAYHTVGSSMAVRASAYCRYGGMNKRKAGEDFYFLQKFISKGCFKVVNQTCVIPSPRISDRVPFGTGKAIGEIVLLNNQTCYTYHYQSFIDLMPLIQQLEIIFASGWDKIKNAFSDKVVLYFESLGIVQKLAECKQHSNDYIGFRKRFFHWFDAFALMKYIHYFRDHYYNDIPVEDAVKYFIQLKDESLFVTKPKWMLELLRKWDREE